MKTRLTLLIVLFVAMLSSCLTPDFPSLEGQSDINTLKFPSGFDWTTQKNVTIVLEQKIAPQFLNFNLYYIDENQKMVLGNYNLPSLSNIEIGISVPKNCTEVYLEPLNSIFKDALVLDILNNSKFNITKEQYSIAQKTNSNQYNVVNSVQNKSNITFTYMASYNSLGVPTNLLTPKDNITQSLLNDINASLPESRPVPTYNPGYITTKSMDTKILSTSEVWITFVTEGAGWRNSIGFYTYNLNYPPTSINDINDLTIIFPNSSLSGSGGGLTPGDKVKLGVFQPNTGIGWVLFPNGWDGTKVIANSDLKFSNPNFNTFTQSQYSQHMVFLSDEIRNLILLGFEDTSRPGGDNDFNDAIFYITANPFEAIDISDLSSVKTAVDTDKDGVQDYLDAYPLDPMLSSVEYYQSQKTMAGISFEDMWPAQGDYDFNDLVFDFKYTLKKNSANKVLEMECEYDLKAIGGAFRNGFALALNCSPSSIESVSGTTLSKNVFQTNSNGTEIGQTKAVIPIFDNAYDIFKLYNSGFINTEKLKENLGSKKITLTIKFNSPLKVSDLGSFPFDPFIVINQERGREVHLAGKAPTQLASIELLNTQDDNSKLSGYYLNNRNLPWAILTDGNFEYPIEKAAINTAHLKFIDWAISKGINNTDWYKNLNNNRNPEKIY